jgi:hypothetical protein
VLLSFHPVAMRRPAHRGRSGSGDGRLVSGPGPGRFRRGAGGGLHPGRALPSAAKRKTLTFAETFALFVLKPFYGSPIKARSDLRRIQTAKLTKGTKTTPNFLPIIKHPKGGDLPVAIAIILGTRPEIIKMAPVIRECQRRCLDRCGIRSSEVRLL